MQHKNALLADVSINIELQSRKINVPEHQQESRSDPFAVLAHIFLPSHLLSL